MNHEDLYAVGIRLWNDWTEMWNVRPALAREIVADGFTLHLPTPTALVLESVDGPAAVERWVIAHRAKYQRLTFHTECGPFVDVARGVVAGPWFADTSVDGTPRPVCGMDTIAFRDGKITEYWSLSREVDAVGRWGTSR
jgi:SnoaL-like domain